MQRGFVAETAERICTQQGFEAYASSQALPLVWPARAAHDQQAAVVPVFLPFRGCPVRCVFCAQDVQTGQHVSSGAVPVVAGLDAVLAQASRVLVQRAARAGENGDRPAELAFYGGTFTAMPEKDLAVCLDFAAEALERGWIHSFRCSTRPDSVTAAVLGRLRAAGCTTVELGVQSFADGPLAVSRRGYVGDTARAACAAVREAGLRLGVQLLPGMPGHLPEYFVADVAAALEAGADMLRFYPCLVLEGTELAAMWRKGAYAPWPLAATLAALAKGWLLAAEAGVPVIRMGLAPEPGLKQAVLAGPVDAALGNRVMGRALLLAVGKALDAFGAARPASFDLRLPRGARGCLWGAKGELRAQWVSLGLRQAIFDGALTPALEFEPSNVRA